MNARCGVPGCVRRTEALGLCKAHCWRMRHKGSVLVDRPIGRRVVAGPFCSTAGCDRPVRKRGYCRRCRLREWRQRQVLARSAETVATA